MSYNGYANRNTWVISYSYDAPMVDMTLNFIDDNGELPDVVLMADWLRCMVKNDSEPYLYHLPEFMREMWDISDVDYLTIASNVRDYQEVWDYLNEVAGDIE